MPTKMMQFKILLFFGLLIYIFSDSFVSTFLSNNDTYSKEIQKEILINKKDTLRNVDMKFEFFKFNSSNNIIDIEFKHLHGNECEGFKNTIDF